MLISIVFVVVGLVIAGGVLASHRLPAKHADAAPSADGFQEATISINGRYRPGVIKVRQGVPLRLRFLREEDNPCSERVIFSGLGIDRRLPAFHETTVEFVPTTAGTYLFTCQLGMYRGELVVTPANRSHGKERERKEVTSLG